MSSFMSLLDFRMIEKIALLYSWAFFFGLFGLSCRWFCSKGCLPFVLRMVFFPFYSVGCKRFFFWSNIFLLMAKKTTYLHQNQGLHTISLRWSHSLKIGILLSPIIIYLQFLKLLKMFYIIQQQSQSINPKKLRSTT